MRKCSSRGDFIELCRVAPQYEWTHRTQRTARLADQSGEVENRPVHFPGIVSVNHLLRESLKSAVIAVVRHPSTPEHAHQYPDEVGIDHRHWSSVNAHSHSPPDILANASPIQIFEIVSREQLPARARKRFRSATSKPQGGEVPTKIVRSSSQNVIRRRIAQQEFGKVLRYSGSRRSLKQDLGDDEAKWISPTAPRKVSPVDRVPTGYSAADLPGERQLIRCCVTLAPALRTRM